MGITVIKNRIISDYLMKSRLDEYEKILIYALESGYEHITIYDYYQRLKSNKLFNKKYFIHRHDIDTDSKTARLMFEIEKKYNIKSTYYFRLSTIDYKLMKEINEYGSEASYHQEELSSFCKANHIKNMTQVHEHIKEIRNIFKFNFLNIEQKLCFKLKSVAGHGDFVNRKLGITNSFVLKDNKLRKELGIELEAYDEEIFSSFDMYLRDLPYPYFYKPISPFDAIGKYNIICMLSHPRQWKTNWYENTIDNINRIIEGLKW